jgi:hypothetical protein
VQIVLHNARAVNGICRSICTFFGGGVGDRRFLDVAADGTEVLEKW